MGKINVFIPILLALAFLNVSFGGLPACAPDTATISNTKNVNELHPFSLSDSACVTSLNAATFKDPTVLCGASVSASSGCFSSGLGAADNYTYTPQSNNTAVGCFYPSSLSQPPGDCMESN